MMVDEPGGDGLIARLTAWAKALGEARATAILLSRRGAGHSRWRRADLIWPMFTKDR
jgi:hypothetical protein